MEAFGFQKDKRRSVLWPSGNIPLIKKGSVNQGSVSSGHVGTSDGKVIATEYIALLCRA